MSDMKPFDVHSEYPRVNCPRCNQLTEWSGGGNRLYEEGFCNGCRERMGLPKKDGKDIDTNWEADK